jgi:hypothetical protein
MAGDWLVVCFSTNVVLLVLEPMESHLNVKVCRNTLTGVVIFEMKMDRNRMRVSNECSMDEVNTIRDDAPCCSTHLLLLFV